MTQILVAEDSPTQSAQLAAVLESADFGVMVAPDAEQALHLFRAHEFDVVISDVVMPGMSGYELCRCIKAERRARAIPVILVTSLDDPMEVIHGLESGADSFLRKPYEPDDLIDRIRRIEENLLIRKSQPLSFGMELSFLGRKFTINSEKEQILDLLISTFEDSIRANRELQQSKQDLAAAHARIRTCAHELEDRVRDITEHRATEQQLIQAQKMEAIGNLTGGMAHDFNNLLGVVIGNTDLLREGLKGQPELSELATDVLDAALRGAELTARLLAFARRQPLRPERVEVNKLVSDITKLLQRTLGEQIEIKLNLAPQLWLTQVDPSQLESAIINLATDARDAMHKGGCLMIATRNVHLDADYANEHFDTKPGDYVLVEVSDTGSGIPPEILGRIFEPFFTTKEQGKGTGLGLSMVFGFIHQSGGHINVYSEPGEGTTFRLYLPRDVQDAIATPAQTVVARPEGGGETILVVEDNAKLLTAVVKQLTGLGYRLMTADGPASAMVIIENGDTIDLLLSDVIMPGGTSGIDLARTAVARRPELKVLLTSGFPDTRFGEEASRRLDWPLLSKPYRKEELARAVRASLDGGRAP